METKMITFKEFISERIAKNTWEHLLTSDKQEYADDLIRVVDIAYAHTSLGSFVKSLADVQSSDWEVLDYDDKPDVDVAVFFRRRRSNENWKGKKIQGIGHDGNEESKERLMKQLDKLLSSKGWWIEASGALAKSLLKRGHNPEIDQALLKTVFPAITKFHNDGSYTRTSGKQTITEYVFGDLETDLD